MSNYTHDDQSNIPHHHEQHGATTEHIVQDKPGLMGGGAFWFFIILAGLFVATVNFVKVMGHNAPATHGAATHGMEAPAHHEEAPMEPVNQTANDTVIHSDDALMQNAAKADSLLPKDAAHSTGAH